MDNASAFPGPRFEMVSLYDNLDSYMEPTIDIIIPCYQETDRALRATTEACLSQTLQAQTIYIVDDGSPTPIQLPPDFDSLSRVILLRQEPNEGISYARNVAAARSQADYLLFLDCEILLNPCWLRTVATFMEVHPGVGAACGRLIPRARRFLLTAWRLRFQENIEEQGLETREITFAGHAVLVRRTAFEKIGGYDKRYRRTHEDSDLSRRLRAEGFSTYLVAEACAGSVQVDTLKLLVKKSIRHSEWSLDPNLKNDAILRPLIKRKAFVSQTRSLMSRLARNLIKGRLHFTPIDFLIYFTELRLIRQAEMPPR
jgi:glycosyltransferase involved in cell wall biosynthesis